MKAKASRGILDAKRSGQLEKLADEMENLQKEIEQEKATLQRERSVKIKWKIKKTYFENWISTILKIKDLAAKIKWFSSKN